MSPQNIKNEQIVNEYFEYTDHLSFAQSENTHNSRPIEVENNAQTHPKQLQNNFEP